MGADKGSSKSGGFFHLFDWNRKSRKKLFSSGISPEGTKQAKRSDDNLPTACLRLVDDEDTGGVPSIKGSSDFSCASSVTDEDGNVPKAPGVVARLMGLDSMPSSSSLEPYCTPFCGSQLVCNSHGLQRNPDFTMKGQFGHVPDRTEGYVRQPVESRSQKMPSSPIERFQIETLPPRSAKSLPLTYHKLLSPIKNHGFTSARNAAQIMEAAAKILEPRLQSGAKDKICSFSSSRIPLRVCEPKEEGGIVTSSQRTASRLLQLTRTPVEPNDLRLLPGGQPLSKSWNTAEDIIIFRSSPDPFQIDAVGTKGRGKSVSLAIQAKVNVQRREGLSLPPSRNAGVQKVQGECRSNQPFRSQPNGNQRIKPQKKSLQSSTASGVLRQNNPKQNCLLSRSKSSSNKPVSGQQGRKTLSGDREASSTKQKNPNKIAMNSRTTLDLERVGSSSTNKDFPQKKRLIERSISNEKSEFVDDKSVRSNVLIDEHTKWNKESQDSTDVVSFTFTSPLIKPAGQSRLPSNGYSFEIDGDNSASDMKGKKSLTSGGLNGITGDALSLLLEQKLRELTARIEPSNNFIKAGTFAANSASPAQESRPSLYDHANSESSTGGQLFQTGHKLKVVEEDECSSSNGGMLRDTDNKHLSPFSVLEASFLTESCCSFESSGSSDGSKVCSSNQPLNIGEYSSSSNSSTEAETKLSDSASSSASAETIHNVELKYIREILANTEWRSEFGHLGRNLDPLLFDKLEAGNSNRSCRLNRKLLFDCVSECLDSTWSIYFRAGYRAWTRGVLELRKGLDVEIYNELVGWKKMAEWMVDELVDKDMSARLGTWVDFRIESFETGREIEEDILSSLIDEVMGDICIKI